MIVRCAEKAEMFMSGPIFSSLLSFIFCLSGDEQHPRLVGLLIFCLLAPAVKKLFQGNCDEVSIIYAELKAKTNCKPLVGKACFNIKSKILQQKEKKKKNE